MENAHVLDNGWLGEEDPTTPSQRRERVPLRVEVSAISDSHFFADMTREVSEGGLFVQSVRPLSIGDRVAVSLVMPDGEIHAPGVVQWVRHADAHATPGFGVVFERLSRSALARIEAFCRVRPPIHHESGVN